MFRDNPFPKLLALAALLFGLTGCGASMLGTNDQRPVESIIANAESLIQRKAFAKAADEYAIVIAKQPDVGNHYLRRAELLERIDRDKEARKVYERALDEVADDDPARVELTHRLGLIDANRLQDIDSAELLLMELPSNSIPRFDMAAFLYYQAAQYETSLNLLNQALARVKDDDMKGLLLYHAALVYYRMGDERKTSKTLFEAINHAEHLGLIRDIEDLWDRLNKGLPLDPLLKDYLPNI